MFKKKKKNTLKPLKTMKTPLKPTINATQNHLVLTHEALSPRHALSFHPALDLEWGDSKKPSLWLGTGEQNW